MPRDLPHDRLGVRSRATFQVALGGCGVGVGLALLTGALESSDTGWTGAIPDPLRPIIELMLVLVGLCILVPGLVWMLVPLRGPRPPVVHFEPSHITIRGSLVPKTFVVQRTSVQDIHLRTYGKVLGQGLGMFPMVSVRTTDGRARGIQHLYEGDPDALVQDLANWASVPVGPTRGGVDGTVSTDPSEGPHS